MFLTDFSCIRIQKRSYAEASRRVIPHVVDGLIQTNEVISCILSLFCHVVRATWNDYAVAGHSENIFLYADDVAVVVAGNCVSLWSYYMCVARTSFLWSTLGFLLTMIVC